MFRLSRIQAYAVLGAAVGLSLGFAESARLYFMPRADRFIRPDCSLVIWFLAPLLGEVVFALLGLGLGLVAAWGEDPGRFRRATLMATGAGLTAAYFDLAIRPSYVWIGETVTSRDLTEAVEWFVVAFALAVIAVVLLQFRRSDHSSLDTPPVSRRWTRLIAVVTLVEVVGLGVFALRRVGPFIPRAAASSPPNSGPNVVLIVLDTVRADHLSAYGYHRPTTPNLERLAKKGVLFENAISPASWTIPSFGSYFTGLLPHQHGASAITPVREQLTTLADVLESRGYETAGFNANSTYGLGAWGLAQGFEVYEDDTSSLERNLAHTLLGRELVERLYEGFVSPSYFGRRVGGKLDHEIARWYEHRSHRPFFLFVNYFDAHNPYAAPPPYNKRFPATSEGPGKPAPSRLGAVVPPSHLGTDRSIIVAAYDDCLAYLDDQVGRLADLFMQSPEWPNTIMIITADHGEAFAEHGTYLHGMNLYRELVHVPLIVLGKGIPAGQRVSHITRTREVFFTILDLVRGGSSQFGSHSFRRFWTPGAPLAPSDDLAISEMDHMTSLTTSEWHYIVSDNGHSELYRWITDPGEERDLAQVPEYKPVAQLLHDSMRERVIQTTQPWYGTNYLAILTEADSLSIRGAATERAGSRFPKVPNPNDADLLKGLPYH